MAWLLLIVAALLELVWATAIKYADGFTRLWPSAIGIGTAALSFVLLAFAVQRLPVGTAYAVWVGIGAFGVVATGILLLGEAATPGRLTCLALILLGVIGLRLQEA